MRRRRQAAELLGYTGRGLLAHDELLAAGGLYAELYGIQARAYR